MKYIIYYYPKRDKTRLKISNRKFPLKTSCVHAVNSKTPNGVQFTQETSVAYLKYLKDLPRIWEVPREEDNFVYVVDLRESPYTFKKADKKLMSMACVIRDQGIGRVYTHEYEYLSAPQS